MNEDNNNFVKKPGKGWLHSDEEITSGITYTIKYIGCLTVNESMKSLSFEVRTQVARESIRRIAESAQLLNLPRRNKRNDDQLNSILSNNCITQWSGMNVKLSINTQFLKVTQLECKDILFQHTMQNISFACGGDTDIKDFIAYVAKDEKNGRACYVFECPNNLANAVITSIGQAFELRFRKFLNSMPAQVNSNLNISTSPNKNKNTNIDHQQHINNVYPISTKDGNDILKHQIASETLAKNYNSNEHLAAQSYGNHLHRNNYDQNTNQHQLVKSQTNGAVNLNSNKASNGNNDTNLNVSGNKRQHVIMPIDDKLDIMPWFHGLLTRHDAENLLVKNGDFLVRETNKVERQYVLSGRYKNECRHIFLVDPSGVVRTKDRSFNNICHLISYHQENRIPIISKDNELLLQNQITK